MSRTLAELMQQFDFTADDLAENRAGQLSARQRAHISAERLQASIDKAAASVVPVAIVLITLIYLWWIPPLADVLGPLILAVIVLWLLTMWAVTQGVHSLVRRALRRIAHDRAHPLLRRFGRLDAAGDRAFEAGRVERLSGTLRVEDDGEHRYLRLGTRDLTTSVDAEIDERLWRLPPGMHCAVYRLAGVGWVLAVEPLPDSDEGPLAGPAPH